ncbi:hypothetical protein HPB51_026456 [Rhipicephalus microplus]|uniref:Nose resistant-to-fluoxetine protein N-terminal domain-containing protein n=1 Tax=Rhipicephalus microplus TaxID=6941 RepID=A0A9J6D307_RHIMP|nr:hypothetical protein HPB51_026456 [Rhipicephalus microplus]
MFLLLSMAQSRRDSSPFRLLVICLLFEISARCALAENVTVGNDEKSTPPLPPLSPLPPVKAAATDNGTDDILQGLRDMMTSVFDSITPSVMAKTLAAKMRPQCRLALLRTMVALKKLEPWAFRSLRRSSRELINIRYQTAGDLPGGVESSGAVGACWRRRLSQQWWLRRDRSVFRNSTQPVAQPGGEALALDFCCPFDNPTHAFQKALRIKEKYAPLQLHLLRRFQRVSVDAIVVGCLGMWHPVNDCVGRRLCCKHYLRTLKILFSMLRTVPPLLFSVMKKWSTQFALEQLGLNFHTMQSVLLNYASVVYRFIIGLFDATGKYPTGMLQASRVDLGAFDECIETEVRDMYGNVSSRGQYCNVQLQPQKGAIDLNETELLSTLLHPKRNVPVAVFVKDKVAL